MADSTVCFMRHFEKAPHPLGEEIPPTRAAAARYAQVWRTLDRRVPLSALGAQAARSAAARFARAVEGGGAELFRVFASPYRRTIETARAFINTVPYTVPLIIDARLREIDCGARCAGPYDQLCALFPEYAAAVESSGYLNVRVPYGDSHEMRRDGDVRTFLADVADLPGLTLAVTHVGVIDCVHQVVANLSDVDAVARFSDPNRTPYGACYVLPPGSQALAQYLPVEPSA